MLDLPENTNASLAQSLFLEAIENVPADQWDDFINASCGDDTNLNARVKELLAAHRIVDDYLDKQPATVLAGLAGDPSPDALTGSTIGRYELLEPIGRGGMGVVYAARQSKPVIRKVAIKIVKPGMDSKQVIARFEMERQAIAMMDHPNIAHVYDAGETESGLPYFVMELVRGKPITAYCDDAQLTLAERLKLFIQVCKAVQHAHQKGIIHRDIKPSNVMVTIHDGVAIPKIIDFGVAKAIPQTVSDAAALTLYPQLIGTPLYMSPEQAELKGNDVDTRTDIYSLGVLLYEMLTGTTPFGLRELYDGGYDEMRRKIREDDPPRPSTRISRFDQETVTDVLQCRRTDLKQLSLTLKGDLDWIVLRAIEKDRNRRYQTANEFAADVKRFLNDEPIVARPPSAAYRIGKFTRRYRGILSSLAAIVGILIIGLAVSTWQAIEMARARKIAEERSHVAELANQRSQRLLYISDMKVASDALRRDDIPLAMELLDRHLPKENEHDLRGFEWYYMRQLVDVPSHAEMECPEQLFCVRPSPDGKFLAGGCNDGNVYIFETATKKLVRTLATESESANCSCWSADQSEITTADANGALKTWSTADGRLLRTIAAHEGEAFCVRYTPDDTTLVSSGTDSQIYLWDRVTGKKTGTLVGHERQVGQIAISPDGRFLASASDDGSLRLWDLKSQELQNSWNPKDARMLCVAFSSDGAYLAAGTVHGGVFLVDMNSRTFRKLVDQVDGVEAIAWMNGSEWVVTGDRGGAIHYWPLTDGSGDIIHTFDRKITPSWHAHSNRIQTLAIIPDSNLMVSSGRDHLIKIWTAKPRSSQWNLASARRGARGISLGLENQLYVADETNIVRWDLRRRQSEPVFSTPQPIWRYLATSRDGSSLVASDIETLYFFDLPSQKLLRTWQRPPNLDDPRLAVSPDHRRFATAWWETSDHVDVYDIDQPQPVMRFPATQCNCVQFSPDGKRLAFGTMNDLVIVDMANPQSQLQLCGHTTTLSECAFHPSGKFIATVSHDRRLKLWNAVSGELLYSVVAHRDKIKAVAFSPDGNTLATGGNDLTVKLWNRQTGQPLFDFGIETGEIEQVLFAHDGKQLICLLNTGAIVVYDITVPPENERVAAAPNLR